ncbi:MAG: DNA primase [Bacteroidales bacterium]|nr:DNA primase [Bacteroidales bacterium]MBN2819542.1 DNA primase [Bacteroidales bacterium]
MIDRETVDRIFAAADIVEVVSDFVKLKKAGSNFKGLSPFSNEKTPSFFVSPGKGIFKDFSSGLGGNAVKFLMELEKLSYPEALRYLAKKYNIEIHEKEITPEEIQEKNERESLLEVSNFAQKKFSEWLWNRDEGKAIGLSYFKERGFREQTIKNFQLGYSLEARDGFTQVATEKGYKLEYLIKTGLTIEKNNYRFDRFSGRVIFPIHSLSGQILGFGGRVLKKDEKTAKYLNSPESEIYHKSHILYGLYFAKQEINKLDKCFLVEGYTDVISMHQAGIQNVVSSSGTALTIEQIRLIKRFTKNITVLYDGDPAGIKASLRGIDLILEEGMNVKVLLLPEGEDPDSFAKAHSSTEFTEFIEQNETDFIRFKTRLLIGEAENDPVQRATLINDIVRSVAVIPDSIVRSVYLRECSKLLDIDEKILYDETYKIRLRKAEDSEKRYYRQESFQNKPEPAQPELTINIKKDFKHEHELVRALLNFGNLQLFPGFDDSPSIMKYVVDEVREDELLFQHPVYNKIFQIISELVDNKMKIDMDFFTRHEDIEISSLSAELLLEDYDGQMSPLWSKNNVRLETEEMKLKEIVPELIISFKNKKVLDMIKETQEEINHAQASNDMESIDLLIQKMQILNELKRNISKKLGDRIILH